MQRCSFCSERLEASAKDDSWIVMDFHPVVDTPACCACLFRLLAALALCAVTDMISRFSTTVQRKRKRDVTTTGKRLGAPRSRKGPRTLQEAPKVTVLSFTPLTSPCVLEVRSTAACDNFFTHKNPCFLGQSQTRPDR